MPGRARLVFSLLCQGQDVRIQSNIAAVGAAVAALAASAGDTASSEEEDPENLKQGARALHDLQAESLSNNAMVSARPIPLHHWKAVPTPGIRPGAGHTQEMQAGVRASIIRLRSLLW